MRLLTSIPAILVTATGAFAAESTSAASSAVVVVEITEKNIILGELEQKHPTALFQAQHTFFETQRKAVIALVDQYPLEEQAKKDLAMGQSWEKHVTSKIAKNPAEEALRVCFERVETKFDKYLDPIEKVRISKIHSKAAQALGAQGTPTIVGNMAVTQAFQR